MGGPRAGQSGVAGGRRLSIILEPLRIEHAGEMARVLASAELYRFTGGQPPSVEELRERYARQVVGRSPDGRAVWHNWVVHRLAAGAAFGWIQATVTGSAARPTAELAWTTAADQQRRGYARAAARAAMAELRGEGVSRFVAHVHPGHAASIAVARSLGMAPTEQIDDGEVLWATPE
jgi:RimJ/RimL family protein N-acetyltransferase